MPEDHPGTGGPLSELSSSSGPKLAHPSDEVLLRPPSVSTPESQGTGKQREFDTSESPKSPEDVFASPPAPIGMPHSSAQGGYMTQEPQNQALYYQNLPQCPSLQHAGGTNTDPPAGRPESIAKGFESQPLSTSAVGIECPALEEFDIPLKPHRSSSARVAGNDDALRKAAGAHPQLQNTDSGGSSNPEPNLELLLREWTTLYD